LLTENDDSENNQVGGMSTSPRISKMMSFEWLGQTLASMCWIISVFVYETDVNLWSNGDWLQLAAASSWMVSNIASVVNLKVD
tara:strand:+ start:918 stop:1166 length:249 start_codon:yes stop_codon:yes gene_type:complete